MMPEKYLAYKLTQKPLKKIFHLLLEEHAVTVLSFDYHMATEENFGTASFADSVALRLETKHGDH